MKALVFCVSKTFFNPGLDDVDRRCYDLPQNRSILRAKMCDKNCRQMKKLKPYDAVIARASAINLLGAPGEIRTRGLHIRSVLLYPLSYWRRSMADQLQINNKSTANKSDLNILAQRKSYHKQICLYI